MAEQTMATSAPLHRGGLHGSLGDPVLSSMNFLNEIAERYPGVVSFAAGRPTEEFFDIADLHSYLDLFCAHLTGTGASAAAVRRALFQYGRTKGIIHELVARNLAVDEGIEVDPESIVITAGCQEAMFLVLRALRRDERDVLLAVAPTYVGLTGAASLVDLPVVGVPGGPAGIDPGKLLGQIRSVKAQGLRPRGLYVMADWANPTGVSLDHGQRRQLLDIAEQEDILLLEDNPYGLFALDGVPGTPTLKALDRTGRVIYFGTFAKTVLPGARVGYVIADQRVGDGGGATNLLADELSKIKSMLTLNTSPIAQAIVGGRLLANDCSLVRATERERAHYAANLRALLTGLRHRFPDGNGPDSTVSWNTPAGGFFVVVGLPFPADDALLEISARDYGVLWTPMHHFYSGLRGVPALRLSCSAVNPGQIETGLDRLARLIRDRMPRAATAEHGEEQIGAADAVRPG